MPGTPEARTTRRRAITLVPLAVASAAITAQVATMGGATLSPLAAAPQTGASYDPIRPTVPQAAIEAAASLSAPATSGTVTPAQARKATAEARTGSIPPLALSAYQRAEVVLADADTACGLPWQLVAAIGRVESNHGQYGGNTLDSEGIATPGIYGVALDGTRGTQAIEDTDAGRYDRDTTWDRAVGPMQFIPSTWSQVGVDGDADGRRDPQDIDDAALGAAVYLCAGDDDLSTDEGRRASVFRYNHSTAYVQMVLAIMDGYFDGDWSAGGTTAASSQIDDPTAPVISAGQPPAGPSSHGTSSGQSTQTPTSQPSAAPTAQPSPTTPPTQPTTPPSGPKPTPTPTPGTKPQDPKPDEPKPQPTPTPTHTPGPLAPAVTPVQPITDPVLAPVLSLTDALNLCAQEFDKVFDPLGLLAGAKRACADEVVGTTTQQALGLIPNTLRGLLVWLGLVRP